MEFIRSKLKNLIDLTRKKLNLEHNLTVLLGVLTLVVVTTCGIYIYKINNQIYTVKVNNKTIGYIKDVRVYDNVIDSIKKTDGDSKIKYITLDKAKNDIKSFLTEEEMEKLSREALNLKMPAVAIYSDNTNMAIVGNTEDAKRVIEGIKKLYEPNIENSKVTITSVTIQEKITTADTYADPQMIMDADDAIQNIKNGKQDRKTYTIKDGDTIWDIAIKNNIDIEDIQAANRGTNIDRIKPGEVLYLTYFTPYIHVKIEADVDGQEQIPYEVKNVSDKSIAKGVKKVKQQGEYGLMNVKKHISVVNGEVVSENVVSSKVIREPKNMIYAVGSKSQELYASTGFIRPSRGYMSSGFGSRWGRRHTGIDIAASTGSPIKAANSGKVIFAGWKGGYGNCVMISHGNGYQTLYGHASKLYVKVGQMVKKGDVIAAVGSTGHSTGPHVHFEVRKNGVPINPLKYL